ncbi:preprotein translocase subunit YajC [Flavobacterium zhairuonense]|uniref:preprotein translocase subunit YajC n=1 Tax=Flavobacterium zhairuonense TaxID=2493631 RepID=UPI001052C235|nr:preprotein translocase subunit YajC [Flavobacterium zhairuonense]KAF2512730.1 preprotein translocase subunit YajC [Flavobacterium zhairuonense]
MGNYMLYLQLGLMGVIIYLFMFRPAQRKAKAEKEFKESLKVGDKIVTVGGIHGKVTEIAEATVVIETMSGKLKLDRSSISIEKTAVLNAKKA